MSTERLTVSLDAELAAAIRVAASSESDNVSAWLSQAARRQLAWEGMRTVVSEWEEEHSPFSEDELATARQLLGR